MFFLPFRGRNVVPDSGRLFFGTFGRTCIRQSGIPFSDGKAFSGACGCGDESDTGSGICGIGIDLGRF